jgi:hypothetical protein
MTDLSHAALVQLLVAEKPQYVELQAQQGFS